MCGGGGGGGQMQMPQDNSIQLEMMRQQQARDEQARQDALNAESRTNFQHARNTASNEGAEVGKNYLRSVGLQGEVGNMDDLILSITRDINNQVPDLDVNPSSYFTPEAYEAGFNRAQEGKRTAFGRQVNSTFAPGFEETLLPDNSIDSIIDSILGKQSATARQSIDANQKRGTLNDMGYQNALLELGNQETAGRSTLRGIGESVLGKERGELSAIRGQAGDLASSYTFGSNAPDIGSFYNRAQAEAGRDLQGLEGSILASLGSTSLFDVPSALAKGGTMQGGINLTTQSGVAPFSDEAKRKSTGRGLGSTGTF